METDRIEYIAPTMRAFAGMKGILFRPFAPGKWFVLGFSAWLATIGEGGSGGNFQSYESSGTDEPGSFSEFLQSAAAWLRENLAMALTVGILVALVLAVVAIALLWVRSRGKFLFLDNVLHDRTLIAEPWKRFRSVGNSLFWWQLAFGLTVLAGFLSLGGGAAYLAWPMLEEGDFDPRSLPALVAIAAGAAVLALAAGYVGMLLEYFVIPLMHREGLPARAAWGKFLLLHRARPGAFVRFFLWTIVVGLLAGIAVMLVVLGTCCVAAIPLMIPYLGTVLLLPLLVFLRLLGPEFLAQFGDPYDVFVDRASGPPALN